MGIEFLIDNSKKEIERLNKLISEIGIVKKPDEKAKFLKKFMVEAIRARHHTHAARKHGLDKIPLQPVMIKPARRQIPYFKPHEIHKIRRLPMKKSYFTISEHEYPLLKAGNYTLVRAVVDRDYKVIEPGLTDFDVRIINDIKSKGLTRDDDIRARLQAFAGQLGSVISDDYLEKIKFYVNRDNTLGKIVFIMRDERVKTVTCSGPKQIVHITLNGKDYETDIMYGSIEEVNNVVRGLARMASVEINMNDPILDVTLPNGTRLQGIFGNEIVTPKFIISR